MRDVKHDDKLINRLCLRRNRDARDTRNCQSSKRLQVIKDANGASHFLPGSRDSSSLGACRRL